MRRIRNRVAGLDVHRDSVTGCVECFDGVDVEVIKQRFVTTATGIRELADWLADFEVELLVMEATGVFWKPVYYGLEDLFDDVWLVNAHQVKNVPGRRTYMSDAQWLADVAAHGMVRPSIVPPPPIRALRELTRYPRTVDDVRAQCSAAEPVRAVGIVLDLSKSHTWRQPDQSEQALHASRSGSAQTELFGEFVR